MINVSKIWLAFFGVIFLFDQMLLPMFHIGGIPLKVSYFLLVFALFIRLDAPINVTSFYQSTLKSILAFTLILFVAMLYFNTISFDNQFSETARMLMVFILSLGSLKLGMLSSSLPPKYLTFTLVGVMVLIVFLVFFPGICTINIQNVLENDRSVSGNVNPK